jgi:glyoxylase-like metal-dependent hydrolase (beta-lactamase superfamily II)
MEYSIRALKMGQSDVPGPEVYWMEAWGTWETLYFMAFLVQGSGHNILINTGVPQDLTELNARWLEAFGEPRAQLMRQEEERPQNALRALGLAPDDITHIIVTPLQAYATANIHTFRNAQICLSRKGWIEDFQAPTYHMHVPRHLRIPRDVNDYLQNEGWEKLRLLHDEDEVLPGITTFWAGVHHRSSMAIAVNTAKGKVIITDSFFKYRNIEEWVYLGVQESLLEATSTWERLKKEGDILVPIYDPAVFQRFPGGVIA